MTEHEHRIEGPRARCFAEPWRCDTISLYVHWKERLGSGGYHPEGGYRLKPVGSTSERPEFKWVEPSEMQGRSTLELSTEAAQELMNSLWECGIRPVQGKGSAGQLDATLRHLEDVRQIAFAKLEIGKP